MAWPQARDQLVTIVTETIGLTQARGLPPKFRYVASADERTTLDSRSFFFELIQAADRRLIRSAGATWTTALIDLVIAYKDDVAVASRIEAQLSDYRALSVRLLDDGNWGRPASTITRIGDGPALLVATVDSNNPFNRAMRIRIPIDFT